MKHSGSVIIATNALPRLLIATVLTTLAIGTTLIFWGLALYNIHQNPKEHQSFGNGSLTQYYMFTNEDPHFSYGCGNNTWGCHYPRGVLMFNKGSNETDGGGGGQEGGGNKDDNKGGGKGKPPDGKPPGGKPPGEKPPDSKPPDAKPPETKGKRKKIKQTTVTPVKMTTKFKKGNTTNECCAKGGIDDDITSVTNTFYTTQSELSLISKVTKGPSTKRSTFVKQGVDIFQIVFPVFQIDTTPVPRNNQKIDVK